MARTKRRKFEIRWDKKNTHWVLVEGKKQIDWAIHKGELVRGAREMCREFLSRGEPCQLTIKNKNGKIGSLGEATYGADPRRTKG